MRMLACLTAHSYELEGHNIYPAGFNRRKIIGEAQILSAPLLDGLARKRKSLPLGFLVIFINDQVIAAGLARKISIDKFGLKQTVTYGFSFETFKTRIHFVLKDLLVLFRRPLSLF